MADRSHLAVMAQSSPYLYSQARLGSSRQWAKGEEWLRSRLSPGP